MGSKEKRDVALREIIHSWNKIANRRDWILRKVQELFSKEHQRANIIGNIKGERIEEGEQAVRRVKGLVEEEKRISKELEHYLEQCRLLIVHQQKRIKEFEKNL